MQVYAGQLKKLGISTMRGNQKKYSIVEIGDNVVQKVVVHPKLDSFLEDGLHTTEPTKIWTINMGIASKGLVGVQVGDGKKYMAAPFSMFGNIAVFGVHTLVGLAIIFSGAGQAGHAVGGFLVLMCVWLLYRTVFQYMAISKDGATVL